MYTMASSGTLSLQLSSMKLWANPNKSKEMIAGEITGMICLGSIVFFRWEKYRFVLVMISFSAFHFCTIIAVIVNAQDQLHKKPAKAFRIATKLRWLFVSA